jgi:hypothetical protein
MADEKDSRVPVDQAVDDRVSEDSEGMNPLAPRERTADARMLDDQPDNPLILGEEPCHCARACMLGMVIRGFIKVALDLGMNGVDHSTL